MMILKLLPHVQAAMSIVLAYMILCIINNIKIKKDISINKQLLIHVLDMIID